MKQNNQCSGPEMLLGEVGSKRQSCMSDNDLHNMHASTDCMRNACTSDDLTSKHGCIPHYGKHWLTAIKPVRLLPFTLISSRVESKTLKKLPMTRSIFEGSPASCNSPKYSDTCFISAFTAFSRACTCDCISDAPLRHSCGRKIECCRKCRCSVWKQIGVRRSTQTFAHTHTRTHTRQDSH